MHFSILHHRSVKVYDGNINFMSNFDFSSFVRQKFCPPPFSSFYIHKKQKIYVFLKEQCFWKQVNISVYMSKNIKFKNFFQKCFSLMTFVHHLLFVYYIVVQVYPWFKFYLYIIYKHYIFIPLLGGIATKYTLYILLNATGDWSQRKK